MTTTTAPILEHFALFENFWIPAGIIYMPTTLWLAASWDTILIFLLGHPYNGMLIVCIQNSLIPFKCLQAASVIKHLEHRKNWSKRIHKVIKLRNCYVIVRASSTGCEMQTYGGKGYEMPPSTLRDTLFQ